MNIPLPVQKAIHIIEDNGYEAYLVGGCVRDMLMGKTPHDYDITTNALPLAVKAMFPGYTVVETGLKHGTVTVVIDKENIEITTYRIDGEYMDNRRPQQVRFTTSVADDLSRRDFTVNAMAYSPTRGYVDLFDGQADINRKVIKCVGNPDLRFNEDGLRIMRALRFAAVLGFEIDGETSQSIHRNKHLLSNISAERIYSELSRLVCGEKSVDIIREYVDVIGVFLPELTAMVGCEQNTKYHCYDVFEHTLHAFETTPPKLEPRLGALLHDVGKPLCKTTDENGADHFKGHAAKGEEMAREIFNRLKTDNYIKNYVCDLIRVHDRNLTTDTKDIRKRLSKYGYDFLCDLLSVQIGDSIAHAEPYRTFAQNADSIKNALDEVYKQEGRLTLKDLKINGNDLITMGITDGRQIGEILKTLLNKVLNGEVENDKEILKSIIKSELM